eukprot:GHVL01017920.1.p1 GENE.GHVL01017920.1~~GHVL01017920.1.p1  ORF type:complete len:1309 (+),score=187.59 GHVL01017920.1:3213-7139(+)
MSSISGDSITLSTSTSIGGTSTIADLCEDDKSRIGQLVKQLANARLQHKAKENEVNRIKQGYEEKCAELTKHNMNLSMETSTLRTKFQQSLKLLKTVVQSKTPKTGENNNDSINNENSNGVEKSAVKCESISTNIGHKKKRSNNESSIENIEVRQGELNFNPLFSPSEPPSASSVQRTPTTEHHDGKNNSLLSSDVTMPLDSPHQINSHNTSENKHTNITSDRTPTTSSTPAEKHFAVQIKNIPSTIMRDDVQSQNINQPTLIQCVQIDEKQEKYAPQTDTTHYEHDSVHSPCSSNETAALFEREHTIQAPFNGQKALQQEQSGVTQLKPIATYHKNQFDHDPLHTPCDRKQSSVTQHQPTTISHTNAFDDEPLHTPCDRQQSSVPQHQPTTTSHTNAFHSEPLYTSSDRQPSGLTQHQPTATSHTNAFHSEPLYTPCDRQQSSVPQHQPTTISHSNAFYSEPLYTPSDRQPSGLTQHQPTATSHTIEFHSEPLYTPSDRQLSGVRQHQPSATAHSNQFNHEPLYTPNPRQQSAVTLLNPSATSYTKAFQREPLYTPCDREQSDSSQQNCTASPLTNEFNNEPLYTPCDREMINVTQNKSTVCVKSNSNKYDQKTIYTSCEQSSSFYKQTPHNLTKGPYANDQQLTPCEPPPPFSHNPLYTPVEPNNRATVPSQNSSSNIRDSTSIANPAMCDISPLMPEKTKSFIPYTPSNPSRTKNDEGTLLKEPLFTPLNTDIRGSLGESDWFLLSRYTTPKTLASAQSAAVASRTKKMNEKPVPMPCSFYEQTPCKTDSFTNNPTNPSIIGSRPTAPSFSTEPQQMRLELKQLETNSSSLVPPSAKRGGMNSTANDSRLICGSARTSDTFFNTPTFQKSNSVSKDWVNSQNILQLSLGSSVMSERCDEALKLSNGSSLNESLATLSGREWGERVLPTPSFLMDARKTKEPSHHSYSIEAINMPVSLEQNLRPVQSEQNGSDHTYCMNDTNHSINNIAEYPQSYSAQVHYGQTIHPVHFDSQQHKIVNYHNRVHRNNYPNKSFDHLIDGHSEQQVVKNAQHNRRETKNVEELDNNSVVEMWHDTSELPQYNESCNLNYFDGHPRHNSNSSKNGQNSQETRRTIVGLTNKKENGRDVNDVRTAMQARDILSHKTKAAPTIRMSKENSLRHKYKTDSQSIWSDGDNDISSKSAHRVIVTENLEDTFSFSKKHLIGEYHDTTTLTCKYNKRLFDVIDSTYSEATNYSVDDSVGDYRENEYMYLDDSHCRSFYESECDDLSGYEDNVDRTMYSFSDEYGYSQETRVRRQQGRHNKPVWR